MLHKCLIILCIALCINVYAAEHASIVINANNNRILHSCNANEIRHPASLTKMMTVYLLFDMLKYKKMTMKDKIIISKEANQLPPSKLDVKNGESITVEDAIKAIIVKSANNVAYAVAMKLGSNDMNKFVRMMNAKAQKLGMRKTHFVNPHGLHHDKQVTTACDIAKLAIALRKYHPKYYHFFKQHEFYFKKKKITGHNHVLKHKRQVDGIKTGFVNASGFNLASSLKNKYHNIVAVVMGESSAKKRDHIMIQLLDKYSKQ